MFGAKLSWCQIVRCQIVLVPNCPGAKLSTFIILVPNCPLLLSWCQIVRFIILVPNCPVPNCPTIRTTSVTLETIYVILLFERRHMNVISQKSWQAIHLTCNNAMLTKFVFNRALIHVGRGLSHPWHK